ITVRSLRWPGDIPKSPYQVPVKGCPSWATAATVIVNTAATTKNKRTDFIRLLPYGTKNFVLSISCWLPSINSGPWLLSWQTYSKGSRLGDQRMVNSVVVHGAVYVPGSSIVA